MINRRGAEENKYAEKLKNTLHTSDSKERRESRYLLPCQYQQCRTITKPDSSGVSFDKIDRGYATMASVRRL